MTVRIHAGRWRGSTLGVADMPGLRPTSSRLRETLANWLRPKQPFTHVLDLFAGSGALGFEVCSQAETEVTFVDIQPSLVQGIQQNGNKLGLQSGHYVCSDARQFLDSTTQKYDLVLLDPPFALPWMQQLPQYLEQSLIIGNNSLIYLEQPRTSTVDIPDNWQEIQQAQAGQVRISIYQRSSI